MDSSQRVPPMSPCPPLIITMVCPWLINHLSDPWNFNNSNGILLRSNWRKPYPKFYGSEFYGSEPFIYGCFFRYLLPSRGVINPVLALFPFFSSNHNDVLSQKSLSKGFYVKPPSPHWVKSSTSSMPKKIKKASPMMGPAFELAVSCLKKWLNSMVYGRSKMIELPSGKLT